MKVSTTIEARGFGTHPYKRVIGLTNEEKQAVRNGETVIFDCGRMANGNSGTVLRVVTFYKYAGREYWTLRVPTLTELAEYVRIMAKEVTDEQARHQITSVANDVIHVFGGDK